MASVKEMQDRHYEENHRELARLRGTVDVLKQERNALRSVLNQLLQERENRVHTLEAICNNNARYGLGVEELRLIKNAFVCKGACDGKLHFADDLGKVIDEETTLCKSCNDELEEAREKYRREYRYYNDRAWD